MFIIARLVNRGKLGFLTHTKISQQPEKTNTQLIALGLDISMFNSLKLILSYFFNFGLASYCLNII